MNPLPFYATTLPVIDKNRFENKLSYQGVRLKNPYIIPRGDWLDNPKLWPSTQWPDIYEYLVEKTSVYTKEAIRAYRSLDGYNHLICGHVQTLYVTKAEDGVCFIRGKVLPSQRQGDRAEFYDAWVCIEAGCNVSGVVTANCTCMAGLGGACCHVAAILFKLESSVRCGIKESASTSEACKWNQVSKSKVQPASLADIDFTHHQRGEKRKKKIPQYVPAKKMDMTPAMWEDLHKADPQAAVFTSLYTDRDSSETDTASEGEDSVRMPAPLTNLYSYQACTMSKDEVSSLCKTIYHDLPESISADQCAFLEEKTRKQHDSEEWFEQKAGRITASNFHRAYTLRDTTDRSNFVRDVTHPNSTPVKTAAIKWGLSQEETARKAYKTVVQNSHTDFTCRRSGLVVNRHFPYLGASPDGQVECTCCGIGALEIKCPFKYKEGLPVDTCIDSLNDKSFCLTKEHTLKKTHKYYYQVQGQIAVMDVQYCDFFLWCPKNCILIRIQRDNAFISVMMEKLQQEFKLYVLPELVTKSVYCTLYDNVRRYCLCQRPCFGKMVGCHGKFCQKQWFHYTCVGIKRAPKGNWLCPDCKGITNEP